jgi:flagellar hook protein FlgE
MSINSAMRTGVAGLTANAAALSVISNNIANVNTVGFKSSSAQFANLVSNSGGGQSPEGAGVTSSARQYVSLQGALQRSTSSTDVAISGQGFFTVSNGYAAQTSSSDRSFTRVGDFTADKNGYLKNSSGQYLLGWPVQSDGTIDYDPADVTKLDSINVNSQVSATTNVSVGANVNSETAVYPGVTLGTTLYPYNAAVPINTLTASFPAYTNNMSAYLDYLEANPTAITLPGVKPDFQMTIPVSDSKGGRHDLTIALSKNKNAASNTWDMEIRGKTSELSGSTNGLLAQGQIKFKTDGTIDMTATNLLNPFTSTDATPTVYTPPLADAPTGTFKFPLSIGASSATTGIRFAAGLGVAAQTINIDMEKVTQTAKTSLMNSLTTDGTAFANQISTAIDSDGYVSAVYDNGSTRKIAQLAIAKFSNPDGLDMKTGGLFTPSRTSGDFTLNKAGTNSTGAISGNNLEGSNVDLSLEFTGLITTQRAYSASSKIITTSDQMLDELINIKR